MENCDFLVDLKTKANTVTIEDFSRDGVKMQVNLSGKINGKYQANHVETSTDLMKMDGTMEWESRAVETTDDGDVIYVNGNGVGEQLEGTEMSIKGELLYLTESPRLSWLNNSKAYIEGVTDTRKGEAEFKIYALTEEPQEVAIPAM
jgi:hypothetical protein